MTGKIKLETQNLYEQDYQLWVETTLEQSRNGHYSGVDWENLLEEIEGITKKDKRKLMSLLTRLFEHFLKLTYWELEKEYNQAGWKGEIHNFRILIKRLLKDSPSLKPYLVEILDECYQNTVKITSQKINIFSEIFPSNPIANLEQVLDDNWLPNRLDF